MATPFGSAPRALASRLAALLLALGAALSPAAPADACINEVEHRIDPRTQLLAQADVDVAEGRNLEALTTVAMAFPGAGPPASPLHARALVLAARAIARSGGRFGLGGKSAEGDAQRESHVALAVRLLEEQIARTPTDAVLRTDLAEALSLVPSRRREAMMSLADFERRNVMASAQGYRALARLRGQVGEGKPAVLGAPLAAFERAPQRLARARCERMASSPAICRT